MGSEVNIMHLAYATKLRLCARKIEVGVQKIDGFYLDILEIVIVDFTVKNKLRTVWFFQETFLLANIGLEMVLGIFFLTHSRANIRFTERKFVWRTYTAAEALPITKKVEIINKKKFAVVVLNANNEIFVMYIAVLAEPTTMPIYPSYQAQVASLNSEETEIPAEYSDFSNVFSLDSTAELPEHTRINNHPINLLDNKQPPYGPIYSPRPVESEILKTYIKANLASSFIRLFKSLAGTLIPFVQKKNNSLRFCVDYQGLNNLTIKNCCLLPLIRKSLNCLNCAKCFTQLDLTNTYHWMRIQKGNK